MHEINYNREDAVAYALKWGLKRNKAYYDFQNIGGDCTNFVSQCIFAGAKVMNFTPITGWYYRSVNDRTASWSGVDYFYRFLVNNNSVGPYAYEASEKEIKKGDIVQLKNESGYYYHTLIITSLIPTILVTAHTYDVINRPLFAYRYNSARFLHISGVRKY